ncbi:cytochrome c oxidase subunit II [Treponema primitia]|uniref:cytoplasmic filament protein CfpA n=1 Tax=Treponema primitia TaxID=88058 RepID=UPI00397FC03C
MESTNDDDVNRLMQEETEKVIHHISAKLPKEILENLDQNGGLKEKLFSYFNQSFQAVARYVPKDIGELLDQVGGSDKFNTREVEKSLVNMYGHLQGHIQRGINELENQTNSLLRHNSDSGVFIRGDKSYTVVKSAFRDNPERPKTVTDLKLCVNILEAELVSPIFHYQVTMEYLIKDILSKNIIETIDKEVEKLRDERLDEGLDELSDSEIIINKLEKVEEFTDDNPGQAKAKRYSLIAKEILDRLKDTRAEIDPSEYDQLNIRENLKKIVDGENIRDRGFNTAVNSLTSILDNSRLGFQYVENFKNARELLIREYDDSDAADLPDEHYQIRMRYYDGSQILEERKAYDVQMKSFETEILHVWDILQLIYEDSKSPFKVSDFKDLTLKTRDRLRKMNKGKPEAPLYEDIEKPWDGFSFVKAAETDVERMNRTYTYEKERIRQRFALMREMIKDLYGEYDYPAERRSLEEQLNFLEKEYNRFDYGINPYHLHPGLVLDVDITSIKRKRITLEAMSKALNEFLQGVSKSFRDTAFSAPSRPPFPAAQGFGDLVSSVSGGIYLDPPPAKPAEKKPKAAKPKKTDGDIREI